MKTVTYHIANCTNSHGKTRADTMVRVRVCTAGQWTWYTGFADATAALAFVKELVRGYRVKLVSV